VRRTACAAVPLDLPGAHNRGPTPPFRHARVVSIPACTSLQEVTRAAARQAQRLALPQVYYVLNHPPTGWAGGVGHVTADMIRAHLPPPGPGVLVLRCGPPPMNKAMAAHLDALGYSKDMQFEF